MMRRVGAAALAAAMVMAACGGDDSGVSSVTTAEGSGASTANAATGTPIVLGAVGSTSGVDIFPEPMAAAAAVFDRLNAEGGINGRPIEYLVEDDGNTAEGATAAARRLVEDENVLAMVGGGSIVDCTTNAKYYAERNIYSLAGANACAEAATVTSMNTGPFLGTLMTFSYLADVAKAEPICFSGLNIGLTPLFVDIFIPMWEAETGKTIKSVITSEPNEDLTAAVTKASSDGCKSVLLAYTEPNYIAYAQIAEGQGLTDGDITYAMLTSGYSLNVADELGSAGEGWFSNSEFLPYTGDDDTAELQEYKDLMEASGQEVTSFGQSGYLAALAMIEALKTIDGEYTQESVNAALSALTYSTPLLGETFTWKPYVGGEQANVASKIVKLEGGEFVTVSDWVYWPPRN